MMPSFDNLNTKRIELASSKITQRNIRPAAVKSRNLADFVFRSGEASASTTLGNNDQAVVTFTADQNDSYPILGFPYIAIYVGSVAAANQLPGGSNIDESQWQVIGPFKDFESWDNNLYILDKEYAKLYIRNVSAGSSTVYVFARWKYLSPREGAGV